MSGNVNATFTQDQVDALVNEAKVEAHASGLAEGIETGMKSEQDRVSAIMAVEGSDMHMALVSKAVANSKFNAEDVKDLMAAMPKAEVLTLEAVQTDQLQTEMSKLENPDVGTDNGDVQVDDVDAVAQMIINAGKLT